VISGLHICIATLVTFRARKIRPSLGYYGPILLGVFSPRISYILTSRVKEETKKE
jgi:hypothetical protein